jgi:NAD(P)-dependent dehydrogenase (short-subunit alcohol dehydrogenase family)
LNLFDEQVVGAASGIGRASTIRMAELGGRIACADVDSEGCHTLVKDLTARGLSAVSVPIDVTDSTSVELGVQQIVHDMGRLDVLVNCAGITGQSHRPSHEVDINDFDLVYHVNLRARFCSPRPSSLTCGNKDTAESCTLRQSPVRTATPGWLPIPRLKRG